jgi:indolepyruvate ferredoxin oxidoreductase beta subunit
MRHDIIIAGVGGQGILTIARLISMAAVSKGLQVKQAEVHGMSQRGGAVYSHLRISDSEIFSDLIPAGQANMIVSIEPLEALRYVQMLQEKGTLVASTNAVTNIGDYPAIENVLDHIAQYEHVAIDMEKLGRAAGSPLAANVVALGAASLFLSFSAAELERAIETLFARKGERVVDTNIRAFRFGRATGSAYLEALQRGAEPASVRGWIETLSAEHLASEDSLEFQGFDETENRLSGAEAHAFENLLMGAYEEGRRQLYEHEVYKLIELVGAISPPRHLFIPKGSTVSAEMLLNFPGERIVLKLVSPDVVHKSDAGAVLILPKTVDVVRSEIDRMVARHTETASVTGTLLVEFVEHANGLGTELFVGIRSTREFGPVIAAGLGGLDTEYLASKMRPGLAVAKAVATDTNADEFLEMFKSTVAYEVLSGQARGHDRVVSDGELLRCFRAFISIARRFCIDRGETGPDIGELEVNPFAFRNQRLIPLDGRGRLKPAAKAKAPRPADRVQALLEPKSLALIGVSSNPESFGRIILGNCLRSSFDPSQMWVVKPDAEQLEGVPCLPKISNLPAVVDLLVITAPSDAVPEIIREANSSGKVKAGIIISGGAGESNPGLGEEIDHAIQDDRVAVYLGPNCMGVQSRPGRYDTFFIPESKLPIRTGTPHPVALISQSGAFIVSRLSSMESLNPAFSVSLGNQADVTVSDVLEALLPRPDVQVAGVYLEGFSNLDGLDTIRAVRRWTEAGKLVIFYKAGRTETGRSAAAGHTAAVAGDYEICETAMTGAGAIVVADFKTFSSMVETSALLASRTALNGNVFAITNAGMEAVGMADALSGQWPDVKLQTPSEPFEIELRKVLQSNKLDRLVSPRNPLDTTPMAGEAAYDALVRCALSQDEVGALIVSCVPLAPQLRSLESDLGSDSFVQYASAWLALSDKPIVFVLDAGSLYDPLAANLREAGVPVLRSADEAMRILAAWLQNRMEVAIPVVPEQQKELQVIG